MLMSLGPIRFEVHPFNATEYDHGHESGFVEKPVLGARPPLEWVGEGPESWSIRARSSSNVRGAFISSFP